MPKLSPIKIVKFKSGECVICEYSVKNAKAILKFPMTIEISPEQSPDIANDETEIELKPWILCSKTNVFEISKSEILIVTNPEKEIVHIYLAYRLDSEQIESKDFIKEIGSDLIDPNVKNKILKDLENDSKKKERKGNSSSEDDFPFFGFTGSSRFGSF